MKADKGAAASGSALYPPGDFQAKACNLLKDRKKKENESTYGVIDNYKKMEKNTHTHTHTQK